MKILFAILLSGICCSLYSQEKAVTAYLLVRIETDYKNTPQHIYFMINAEGGCDEATKLYSLKKFNPKKNAVNTEAAIYPEEKDTSKNYYNYFRSPTLALNFISKNGWELVNIYTETSSGSTVVDNGNIDQRFPITTITSRPVYCFKK